MLTCIAANFYASFFPHKFHSKLSLIMKSAIKFVTDSFKILVVTNKSVEVESYIVHEFFFENFDCKINDEIRWLNK